MKLSRTTVNLQSDDPFDPRIGNILGSELASGTDPKLILLGFPCDIGVSRNNGRPGASKAPDVIRRMLFMMTPDAENYKPFNSILHHTLDLGNLEIQADLERNQENLGEILRPYFLKNIPVIILGGGHETAYGHFLGYVKAGQKIGILNWDAHADVRELKEGRGHSGSPFRQALEHSSGLCDQYTVLGLQPHAVSSVHTHWLKEQSANFIYAGKIKKEAVPGYYNSIRGNHLVTFDLDAVDQSFAPGVSAPAVSGLHPDIWLRAAFEAGKCPFVTSMDIVELNPSFDTDNQTARLAAKTIWMFIKGLQHRI